MVGHGDRRRSDGRTVTVRVTYKTARRLWTLERSTRRRFAKRNARDARRSRKVEAGASFA
jgi:hypothetical protein